MLANQAFHGGAIKLEAAGNLTTWVCTFSQNSATGIGGVLFVTTQSVFNVMNSDFLSNYGNSTSTIDILGGSATLINYIIGCTFQQNTALKNTVSLNQARVSITNCLF